MLLVAHVHFGDNGVHQNRSEGGRISYSRLVDLESSRKGKPFLKGIWRHYHIPRSCFVTSWRDSTRFGAIFDNQINHGTSQEDLQYNAKEAEETGIRSIGPLWNQRFSRILEEIFLADARFHKYFCQYIPIYLFRKNIAKYLDPPLGMTQGLINWCCSRCFEDPWAEE